MAKKELKINGSKGESPLPGINPYYTVKNSELLHPRRQTNLLMEKI